jgi:7-cyano-7-deazaguanine synthase
VSLDLPWLSESTSLVNGEVNDNDVGSYYLNTLDTGVYVPMRNAMFLAIAGSLCESLGIRYIACAFDGAETKITRVPLSGSPDKHPLFVDKMQSALTEGSSLKWSKHKNIKILTPLMDMFKPEIIKKGLEYNADMSLSWSCYNSTEKPCCHCSACRNRIQAFEKLGLKDPVLVKFGL